MCTFFFADISLLNLVSLLFWTFMSEIFFPGGGGGAGAPVHPLRTRLIAVSKAERVVELHFVQGKVF